MLGHQQQTGQPLPLKKLLWNKGLTCTVYNCRNKAFSKMRFFVVLSHFINVIVAYRSHRGFHCDLLSIPIDSGTKYPHPLSYALSTGIRIQYFFMEVVSFYRFNRQKNSYESVTILYFFILFDCEVIQVLFILGCREEKCGPIWRRNEGNGQTS